MSRFIRIGRYKRGLIGILPIGLGEIDRERALEEATVRHLKGRIESLNSQVEEVCADFDAERKDARRREAAIREEFEEAKGYIVYSTSWAHRVSLMHTEYGWKPPIPHWSPFEEWLRDRRDRGGERVVCVVPRCPSLMIPGTPPDPH